MDNNLEQNTPVSPVEVKEEIEPQEIEQPQSVSPPPWMTVSESEVSASPESPAPAGEEMQTPVKKSIFSIIVPILIALVLIVGLYFLITKIVLPALKKGKDGDTAGDGKIILTYWGLWEPENVLSPLIAEYRKTHPNVTINYSQQSYKDYRERLQSAFVRGDEPDIFRFHNTWLAMLKKDMAPAPQDIAQTINIDNNYYMQVGKDVKVGSQVFGVPLGFDGLALFYNTKIFKTAGKQPPTNWEDLRRTALDLTVRGSAGQMEVAGVALGTAENIDHFSDILGLMMLQNGADLSNPTGSLAEDALRFYTLFYTTDKVWDASFPNSTYAFAKEKVAMIFAPSWRAHEIGVLNPSLEYKTVVVPQLPETKVAWASYWVEGVSAKSKNSQAAWEFLQYLSSKEALSQFYANASQVRGFGEPYPRKDMASLLENDEIAGAFVKQADYSQSWYLCSRTHDNGINDKMIQYFKDAVNKVIKGTSASDALKTAAQGVNQVLSQYGIK